jgi:hypothetical protein
MNFCDRLNMLMQLFKVSNSRLACSLNVDPSLVCRWRSGERVVDGNSSHLAAISAFFVKLAGKDTQNLALSQITGLEFCEKPVDTRKTLLTYWLSGGSGEASLGESMKSLLTNVDKLRVLPDLSQKTLPPERVDLPMGKQCTVEFFFGVRGKRSSVIKFLCLALAASAPCELLLVSEEDMEWLTGDPVFFSRWAALLTKVIQKGCTVKIIHTVNRNTQELISVMEKWLPLHLTGKIESFYVPLYRESPFKRTMFVAVGLTAVTSTSVGRASEDSVNYLFTDVSIVASVEKDFRAYLSECTPLMKLFSSHNLEEYTSIATEFLSQSGDCIRGGRLPSLMTMPELLFEKLLGRAGVSKEEQERLLNLHRTRTAAFTSGLKYCVYTEVIRLPPADMPINMLPPLCAAEYNLRTPLFYTKSDLEEHLQHLQTLLADFENFHVIYTKNPLIPLGEGISLSVKSDTGAIISASGTKNDDFMILAVSEPNIIDAFFEFLSDKLDCIPPKHRENEFAQKALHDYLEYLKK